MGKTKELATELREKEWMLLDIRTKAFLRIREQLEAEEYEVRRIEPKGFDYSFDDKWSNLKRKAGNAYKEKKEREFELRMMINEEAKKES